VQIVVQTPKKFSKVQRDLLKQLGDTMHIENKPTNRNLLGKMKDLFS
jgi:molecular chaperone DnaJ